MIRTKFAVFITMLLTAVSVMFAGSPAQAVTGPGQWLTNSSKCTNYATGAILATQGQYQNQYGGPLLYTKFVGYAVATKGYPGVKLRSFEWTLMAVGSNGWPYKWDGYSLGGLAFDVPTGVFIPGKTSSLIAQSLKPYVIYKTVLTNGATCSGQWKIGQP